MPVHAVRLVNIQCRRRDAVFSAVYVNRDLSQVSRIHAEFIAADMVYDQTISQGPMVEQVRIPMRQHALFIDLDLAIYPIPFRSSPGPALARAALIDGRPKTLRRG